MPALLAILALLPLSAQADAADGFSVPLSQHGSGGYYVRGVFADGVESELLIDTGSSYVVLSKDTFARLKRSGVTAFARTIRGTTAAGRLVEAKVYSISALALGTSCVLRDVEAVVLRNADRDILGLSALRRLQPFSLNFEPAELAASTCNSLSKVAFATTTAE